MSPAAVHIFGCYLPADHRGACLLRRPFRIRRSGGRPYRPAPCPGCAHDRDEHLRDQECTVCACDGYRQSEEVRP